MASAFTHAAAALALGTAFADDETPARFWALGAACAAVPDIDVVAFSLGIPYENVLGHRGLTHSLFFAAVLASLVVLIFFRGPAVRGRTARLWAYFFLATASHGVLDAMTNGGLGVAFFAPFDDRRFFFPFHPIQVSPVRPSRFFHARGLVRRRSRPERCSCAGGGPAEGSKLAASGSSRCSTEPSSAPHSPGARRFRRRFPAIR